MENAAPRVRAGPGHYGTLRLLENPAKSRRSTAPSALKSKTRHVPDMGETSKQLWKAAKSNRCASARCWSLCGVGGRTCQVTRTRRPCVGCGVTRARSVLWAASGFSSAWKRSSGVSSAPGNPAQQRRTTGNEYAVPEFLLDSWPSVDNVDDRRPEILYFPSARRYPCPQTRPSCTVPGSRAQEPGSLGDRT